VIQPFFIAPLRQAQRDNEDRDRKLDYPLTNDAKNYKFVEYPETVIIYFSFFPQKRNKKLVAVFLSLRFTSEISTTSVITGVLPRGARISVRYTCSKNKARLDF
jgi:hypothetical protein